MKPGDRLSGPRGCLRSPGAGRKCDRCGAAAATIHLPMRIGGRFCSACCPLCHAAPAAPTSGGGGQ